MNDQVNITKTEEDVAQKKPVFVQRPEDLAVPAEDTTEERVVI